MRTEGFFQPKAGKPFLVYQLGTNNWQREGEFAPGSGILHQAHHAAYNDAAMDGAGGGIKCYSMYPSEKQSVPHEDPTVEVFKLDHPIPICESASPVSSYRWHSMSDDEFKAYRTRLEEAVYSQMADAEEREGTNFSVAVAHHTFLNPLVLRSVLRRREAEGKPRCALVCFVHGTALKMYVHEKIQDIPDEFPPRFLPLLEESKVFNDTYPGDGVQLCYAISAQQVEAFLEIFPTFPRDNVKISPNGIDQNVFHPIEGATIDSVLGRFSSWHYEGSARKSEPIDTSGIEHVVIIVSKFADWKRIPAVLYAASSFEKALPGTALVIVGTGPLEAQKKLQDLAYDTLGLERCYFLGPQPQQVLAELYTIASVGVFPSYKEPFGLVFVETMSTGTPVIGARSGGPKDFVTDDVGHLVEETDDLEELGRRLDVQIQKAIKDDWKSARGEACKKLVADRFSVMKQCSELLDFTKDHLNLS